MVFFLLLTPHFILLISSEIFKHNIWKMTIFLRRKVKYGFKNWPMTEKCCPFSFESYNKIKLPGFTETSFSTALSARYLIFLWYPELDRMPVFYYVALLCSFLFLFLWSWEIFEHFSLKHAIVIYIQVSSFEKTFINPLPR